METFITIQALICYVTYTVFIFLSHYIYRHFKDAQQGSTGFGNLVPGAGNYAAQQDEQEAPPARPTVAPPRSQPQPQSQPQQSQSTFSAFTGQGVRVG